MKPIYKRKWFLIVVGVVALLGVGIISNLTESDEPAPVSTATPRPRHTPTPELMPTPSFVFYSAPPFVLEDDEYIQAALKFQMDSTPSIHTLDRYCGWLDGTEEADSYLLETTAAFGDWAEDAGVLPADSNEALRSWCATRPAQ